MNRFDDREVNAVEKVIRSGKLSPFFSDFYGGEQVQAFEKEFAEYVGAKHAITVSNGTVALEIALKTLGVGRGDEVITTPLSFAATATAILAVGASPIFADITHELVLNRFRVEEAVTKKTKAIIPVSLLGYPVDIPTIKFSNTSIIKTVPTIAHIPVIEDSAQALGASADGKKVGSRAKLSTFSFQETKSVTTLGEGGMITTNDYALAEICYHIRNHGNVYGRLAGVCRYNDSYKVEELVCTNARMTETQAAFGRIQLQKLPEINKTQIENTEYFYNQVLDSPAISEHIMRPLYHRKPLNYTLTYLLMPFYLHDDINRDHLIGYLTAKDITKGIPGHNVGYYKQLLYDLPIFQKYHPKNSSFFHKVPQCPTAERLIRKLILFDIHRWQDRTLIDKCLEALKDYKV